MVRSKVETTAVLLADSWEVLKAELWADDSVALMVRWMVALTVD